MATIFGTTRNDSWLVINPGNFVIDGLGGVDTVNLGTSFPSDYDITLGADGAVHVDSVSGASQQLHATLYNIELLQFDSQRQSIDLRTYFETQSPPTGTLTDSTSGIATGPVSYTLAFSKAVAGLEAGDFSVSGGSVIAVSGSGSSYSVVVQPSPNAEGSIALSLPAGTVLDSSGNPNPLITAAAQTFDTLAPRIVSSPATLTGTVPTTGPLVFDFSEAVRVTAGNLLLKDAGGATVATWSVTSSMVAVSGSRVTITPTAALPAGSTLTLEFSLGLLYDLAGNPMAATKLSFNTTVAIEQKTGTAGNDVFQLGSGQFAVDGLAGVDQVVLGSQRSTFALTKAGSGFMLTTSDGKTGVALTSVERLQFADAKLALDLAGNAGIVAKTLGAVFGKDSVSNAEYAGIGLQLLDTGTSYEALMKLALDVRLGAGASNGAVVDLLYTNVVGVAPTADAKAGFVALLDNKTYTPATLGMLAADTDLNLANIDFTGLSQQGLPYIG